MLPEQHEVRHLFKEKLGKDTDPLAEVLQKSGFRTGAVVSKMKLHGIEHLLLSSLSGGMKQRVGLARALAVDPSCVLMDEPFSALDPELRESLTCMISGLAAERRCRFVIVTHDVSDALFLADQLVILHGSGRAEACGFVAPPHPRSVQYRYTEQFLTGMSTVRALLAIGATKVP